MARINILKQIKVSNRWKLVSIPRKDNDNYDGSRYLRADISSNGGNAANAVGPWVDKQPQKYWTLRVERNTI